MIKADTIHRSIVFQPFQLPGNPVGFHKHQVQLNAVLDLGIGRQHRKGLSILTSGHPHRAEFRREVDCVSPAHEFCFNLVVEILIVGKHLQSRSRPNRVVCEHLDESLCITVVGYFIP